MTLQTYSDWHSLTRSDRTVLHQHVRLWGYCVSRINKICFVFTILYFPCNTCCVDPQELERLRMEPLAEFPGHQLPGGRCLLSPHHKWLATYGTDGSILLRTIGQMVGALQCLNSLMNIILVYFANVGAVFHLFSFF